MARRLVAGVLAGVMVLAGLQAPSAHAAGLTVGLSSNGSTTGLTEWAIGVGQSTSTFYALVSGGTASSFRWWTEDTAVATVSPNGDTATVRGVGDGATKLWVEAKGGGETVTDWAWMSVGANVVDTPGPVVKSGAALYRSRTTASASSGVLSSAVTAMLVTHTSGSWVRVTFPANFVFSADDTYAARAAWVAKSSVDIPPSSVSMSPATLIVEKGRTGSLSATTLQSYANDVTVSWSSGATGTATVSSAGVVSGVNEGVTSVTVAASSSHGVRLTDAATVSVYTPMAAVAATARVAVGARSVADGTSAVLVSLAAGGAVSVVGVCGSYFLVESGGKRGFVPITAIRMPPPEVTLDKSAADLEIGKTLSLTVSAGASYRWWSDDTTVATVTTSGRTITVTGKAQGVAQVWVELADRWGSVGTASAWVTVFADVPDTPGSIAHRDAETWLSATTDGTSRGALAAEVSGTVTAVAGSWVRLSFPSGFSFSDGRSGSTAWLRKADVDIPPVSVTVDVPTRVVEKAGMTQATAIVGHDYANDVALSWTSGATGVATITDAGVIRGVSEGVSVLRVAAASSHGVRFTDTTTVSVYTPDPGVGKLIGAASLRPVADDRSSPVGAAAAGDQVIVLGPCGEYLYIDRDGVRGFVPKSAVAVSAALVSLGASAVSVGIGAKTVLLATPAADAAELSYAWSSTDPELADVSGTARQGTVIGRSEGVAQARVEATDAADESWPAAAWVSVYTPVTLKGKAVTDAGVRMSALPDAPLVAVVDTGAKVSILGVLGGYYYVQAGDERGYVDQPAIALAAGKLSITPAAIAVSTEGVLASVRGTVASGVVDTWEWKSADPRVATAESTRPAVTATGVTQGVTKLQVTATDATGEAQKAAAWVTTYEPFPVTMKGKAISDTPAREAATTDAATWGTVKTGAQVTILGQSGSWWYTDIAATRGFVPKATVIVQVTKVTAPIAVDVPRGGQVTTTAVAEPALAEVTWSWTSAKTAAATVTGNATATVKGVAEGTSQLTAQAKDRAGGTAKAAVWATSYTPAPGATTGYTAVATAMRYWADPAATPLRQLGKGNQLQILGTAGAFFYARTGNTTGWVAKSAITIPATGISVSPSSVSVAAGQNASITATLAPTLSTDTLTWRSGNTTVATVSKGKVTALKPGTTQVTALASSGQWTTVSVRVTQPPAPQPAPSSGKSTLKVLDQGLSSYVLSVGLSAAACRWQVQRQVGGGAWDRVKAESRTSRQGSCGALSGIKVSFRVAGLAGKKIRWRLQTWTSAGKALPVVTTGAYTIGQVTGLTATAQPTSITLRWNKMTGAAGYVISQLKSGVWKQAARVAGDRAVSKMLKASPSKTYTYRVVAVRCVVGDKTCTTKVTAAGSKSILYSGKIAVKTPPKLSTKTLNAKAHKALKRMLLEGALLYEGKEKITSSIKWQVNDAKKKVTKNAHPYLKLRWVSGVLEMHLYVRFVDDGQSGGGKKTWPNPETGKDTASGSFKTNRSLFIKGVNSLWSGKTITGAWGAADGKNQRDFGTNVSFKTKIVWHDYKDRKKKGKEDAKKQQYLTVYMGSTVTDPWNDGATTDEAGGPVCEPRDDPWYHGEHYPGFLFWSDGPYGENRICMPWEWEVDQDEHGSPFYGKNYGKTAGHELGHMLGLSDAYTANHVDRMAENEETTIDGENAVMKYQWNVSRITANDLEMVVHAYAQHGQAGVEHCQSYKTFKKDDPHRCGVISTVIGLTDDQH